MESPNASVKSVHWTLNRTQGPASRPITLEQAKAHLRINQADNTHDDLITDLIDGSVTAVEKRTERCLINQVFEKSGYRFPPPGEGIPLDRDPIVLVDSVTYLDSELVRQTLDPNDWELSVPRNAVYPAPGVSWPTGYVHHDSIQVNFTAGYGTSGDGVPRPLLDCCYLLLTQNFYGVDIYEEYELKIRNYLRRGYP